MIAALAYAQQSDGSASGMVPALLYVAAVAGTGIAAIVPLVLARRRSAGRMDGLLAGAMFWALLTAGSLIWNITQQAQWSAEYLRLMATGYFDPHDQSAAPTRPWVLWGVLAICYVALVLYAWTRRPVPTQQDSPSTE